MYPKSWGCLYLCFLWSAVQSQRIWGSSSSAFTSQFSNSWNPNYGLSSNNNNKKPSTGNGKNAASWGSNVFGFGGRPEQSFSTSSNEQKLNWGYGISSDSGWSQGTPGEVSSGTSAGWEASRRPHNEETSSTTDSSKRNPNAPSSSKDNKLPSSAWGVDNGRKPSRQGGSQNSRPENWFSNGIGGNQPNENEIFTGLDYEDDSVYPSWGSDNKKNKPTLRPSGSFGNWELTTQRSNKNSNEKWEASSNSKPQKPPSFNVWDSNYPSHTGNEKNSANTNGQNEKVSASHTSILDELDKNDWYFGNGSNYPKPPFRSTLNIDVSELWNFVKNKETIQNSSGNSNSGNKNSHKNNRRLNRETKGLVRIQCECVSVNLCEEDDMIITQEDVKFDSRPLEEFRCQKPTDVCCTNPKMKLSNIANFQREREHLQCGERRIAEKQFLELGEDVTDPSEFPWALAMENAQISCGATLIHHSMALTAAHCVEGAQPGGLVLRAGLGNSHEPSQRRRVVKIIPHPDYSSRKPRNDIALLIVEKPYKLTDNVNTICLPVTNDKWDSSKCVVTGWRQDSNHGQILEKGIVSFLPQAECQNIMFVTDLWRNYVLHESFVCGLEKTGRKSCTGDEGSFVICPSQKKPASYVQIGIVSKGINCDEFGRPGIFTNILHFLDWINKNYLEFGLFDDIDIRSFAESQ